MSLEKLKRELNSIADKETAEKLNKYFKTRKGEYGYGDKFIGIKVPILRKITAKYSFNERELEELINSEIHEFRMAALTILVREYKKSKDKESLIKFYLRNTKNINNWDLVDLSASQILGDFLIQRNREVLYRLVKSKSLWERRIAIVSTFAFIRKNDLQDAIKLSEILLEDNHDLINKAVGWVLREVGKKDKKLLEGFLEKYKIKISRTTLRYAIEKFDKEKRDYYMNSSKN